jgi:ABC-type Fe3+ transport system substrate-binding protein
MTYDVGDRARLEVGFTNLAGNPTDPTAVTLKVKAPGTAVVTYTFGVGGTIVKDSTGNYHADIDITVPGKWHYRWTGTGALVVVEETSLFVRKSNV